MTDHSIIIRPFDKITDTDTLVEIWLRASLQAHAFLGPQRLRAQQHLIRATYLPMARTSVACLGTVPIGFISLLDEHIGGLFVAPDMHRHGIGRRLIAQAKQQHKRLSLDVYSANTQAMRFYRALGFQESARHPHDAQGLPFETATLHWQA
ncbi:MAG: GNAT family N-acetyltransferase [Paracoccaceae bacterium]|nr:GNAT family N-acetyltransferase [Paracoccaceae bacterium]